MTEDMYSPLEANEIRAIIQSQISSTPAPASWQILHQQPDALYYGQATKIGFTLILAAGVGRGNSLLEVSGSMMAPDKIGEQGTRIKLTYQPKQASQVAWWCMLLLLLAFLGLALLNYQATGSLNRVILLPIFGLAGLSFFAFLYKCAEQKSRRFLSEILRLQKAPCNF